MLFITDNEFERVVSRARNRDIAREYYRRDYVVNVSITTDNRGYYHISGKVMINGNIYLPRVLVNPNSKIVSTDCNCIYADEYTACGHIGALILKVQELSPNTFPYRYAVDLQKRAQEEKKSAMRERLLWEQRMKEYRRKEREKERHESTYENSSHCFVRCRFRWPWCRRCQARAGEYAVCQRLYFSRYRRGPNP